MMSDHLSAPQIHPSSIVEDGAKLAAGVIIGPFCHIGSEVTLGKGTKLISSVTIMNATTLGEDCLLYPGAILGGTPQDFKYRGEKPTLVIGDRCTFREGSTVHIGTAGGHSTTTLGNDVYLMCTAHVGHNCIIGNNVTIINTTGLAGHTTVEDGVTISASCGIHQFCRIGTKSMIGAGSTVTNDVLPYTTVIGDRAKTVGVNEEGLRRSGWSKERIEGIKAATTMLLKNDQASLLNMTTASPAAEDIKMMIKWAMGSRRGICPPKSRVAPANKL